MEEDIKILKELIEIGLEDFTDITITNRQAQAIQNLIARYKELEEKNKTLETLLQGNLYQMYLYYKELAGRYQANSISKDKVQEKIEELQECCKNCHFRGSICKDFKAFNQCTSQLTIKNLQELLEENTGDHIPRID